ncbi:MAG: ABC transporter permease [Oscillospiraceae bacterium]|nr:ABC transporter permease [Oscillospiraceae bacterium]
MTAFFATFYNGFKYLWRNPVSVTILIVFPILLILILGNALAAYIAPDTEIEPAKIAVDADPEGPLGLFLKREEIARFFTITFTGGEHAKTLIAAGEICAAVIEDGGDISVWRPTVESLQTGLTLSVIDSYQQIGAAATAAVMNGRDISALLPADIRVSEIPLGKRVPDAMDYYAVTMLVMILLYTGQNGMELFGKSLLSDTGSRLRLTPVSGPALIGGLLAASAVTSFLQGMVTFAFSGLVYGVYWGERIPLVLLTLFGVVLFSQSLCIFLIMLFRRQGAAVAAAQALFWVMTFVSKGYAKISFGAADKLFAYAPNAMAHTVIFGAVYGGNEAKMTLFLTLIYGIGAVLFILAFILGRRRTGR